MYDASVFRKEGSEETVQAKGNEYWRFMSYFKHRWIYIVAFIFEMTAGVIPNFMYWYVGKFVTAFVDPNKEFAKQIKKFIADMACFSIAMLVSNGLSTLFRAIANPTCAHDIRCDIFSHLMKQEIAYFDTITMGILVSRISEDVMFALETFVTKLLESVQFITLICCSITLAFVVNWRLALVALTAYPLCLIFYVTGEIYVKRLWVQFRDSSAAASSKAEEVIASFRTVKSFNNELYEAELYSKNLDQDHNIIKNTSYVQAIKNSLKELAFYGVLPAIMYTAVYILYKRPDIKLNIGDIFLSISCGASSAGAIQSLFMIIDDFRKANLSGAKIMQIIDKEPTLDLMAGNTLAEVHGKIEFRNVCFHYQTRDCKVLNNLSFIVQPGQTVAFVGESGCGKTTTLQLLQRFYEIDSGEILVDDIDIKTLSPHYLRSQIAIVPQDPVLFSLSVLDNIRFSRPDAEAEECVDAARLGNSHDFISELPMAYETLINHVSLSGGQKQRICISRAILANAPILLMDEATAALDTESEQLVQQSLEEF